jgi:chemotaxis family two-component system response regulator Rcp1
LHSETPAQRREIGKATQLINKVIEILLVEDNPADVRLMREALKEARVKNVLHVAANGQDAMDFLLNKVKSSEPARPDLIILDLNMPKKDGREVLEDIKKDNELKSIPVVIFTTSGSEEDILKTYKLHANCYIRKPMDLDQFVDVVKSIEGIMALNGQSPV